MSKGVSRESPIVTEMSVVPVAGHDSMLLNLSGAHGPLFTRNVVILKDNAGNTGVGEVPGGARIRQTLEPDRFAVRRASCLTRSIIRDTGQSAYRAGGTPCDRKIS